MEIEQAFQKAVTEISHSLAPSEHGLNLNCQELVLLGFHLKDTKARAFFEGLCSLSDVMDTGITSQTHDRYARILEKIVRSLKNDTLFANFNGNRDCSRMLDALSRYLYDVVHGKRTIGPLAEAYFSAIVEFN